MPSIRAPPQLRHGCGMAAAWLRHGYGMAAIGRLIRTQTNSRMLCSRTHKVRNYGPHFHNFYTYIFIYENVFLQLVYQIYGKKQLFAPDV